MPHYKDGTEAKVGDLVKGTTYNRNDRVIVGTVMEVVPDSEAYNLRVAFVSLERLLPARAIELLERSAFTQTFRTSDGDVFLIEPDYDYGETRAFELVHRDGDVEQELAVARQRAESTYAINAGQR